MATSALINAYLKSNILTLQNEIQIPSHGANVSVPIHQIVCLEADGNYTFIYTNDGKRYLMSKTLKSYVAVLDENIFVRIHKSTIININYLAGVCIDSQRYVKLSSGAKWPISRRRAREIGSLLLNLEQYHA
jgi:two-component system, LytTR family, response regulator